MSRANPILLIISGGIAAYKAIELIRRLREQDHQVRVVMTRAAREFVTPLLASAISGGRVYCDLFDADTQHDVSHIRLAREAELIVVAPASADLMAKMATGIADDLATAILLAARRPVLVAPAMNPAMWAHPATRRNVKMLRKDGVHIIGPDIGDMAESGEAGRGRLAEPETIATEIASLTARRSGRLKGRHVIVTSGPTHEAIDPVRVIANRSSGRQGHAIATAAMRAGADVTLISGPVCIADPPACRTIHVTSAAEMAAAVDAALPADIAIFAAAVSDWRAHNASSEKLKKHAAEDAPDTERQTGGQIVLRLTETIDVLASIGKRDVKRPYLVVGFAAESENLLQNARAKLRRKHADLIIANQVGHGTDTLGGTANKIILIDKEHTQEWPRMDKQEVANRLVAHLAERLQRQN